MLNKLNLTFEACYNGKTALEIIEKRMDYPCSSFCTNFKAIILDCGMPIMDGYTCASKLKEYFNDDP